MKKFWQTIKLLWFGLFLGMKSTEDNTLHQNGINVDDGSTINQQVSDHSVAKALLRGELTQEVMELRYRTYAVAREAGHFSYFSPTLAMKKGVNDFKFLHIENEDNREIITVQENKQEVETVTDALLRIGDDGKFENPEKQYNIIMKRDCTPRFKLEQFTTKVVVKKGDDDSLAVLDIYVSKYPDDKNMTSKPFIKEIERIIDQGIRSDVLNIKSLEFETYKAYRLDDMIRFEFGNLTIEKIFEFDGDYVLRFIADVIDGGTDTTHEFYSESMAKKYENKERKELTIDFDAAMQIRTYKCADCGKEVVYDARALDAMNASDDYGDGKTTEYLDYEMSEHEFGRMLCKECAAKAQEELYRKFKDK